MRLNMVRLRRAGCRVPPDGEIMFRLSIARWLQCGLRVAMPALLCWPLLLASAPVAAGPSAPSGSFYLYLPLALNIPCPSKGQAISGCVKQNSQPAGGVPLSLLYYQPPGLTATSQANTTSAASGYFGFDNAPGAKNFDGYRAEFTNHTNPSQLLYWHSNFSFRPNEPIDLGVVDITNVPLYAPGDGLQITLPYTFTWGARAESPNDDYTFYIADPANPMHSYQQQLGHVSALEIDSLPFGLEYGVQYQWQLHITLYDSQTGITSEADPFQQFHVTFVAPNAPAESK
jgi:hypothetical protein